jgi:hypothetical protein
VRASIKAPDGTEFEMAGKGREGETIALKRAKEAMPAADQNSVSITLWRIGKNKEAIVSTDDSYRASVEWRRTVVDGTEATTVTNTDTVDIAELKAPKEMRLQNKNGKRSLSLSVDGFSLGRRYWFESGDKDKKQ